jgi:hypothetical protein
LVGLSYCRPSPFGTPENHLPTDIFRGHLSHKLIQKRVTSRRRVQ